MIALLGCGGPELVSAAHCAGGTNLHRQVRPKCPVDEPVMTAWARVVFDCRRAGVHRAVRLTDALIAATAIVHGLSVVTQDEDFDQIAAAHLSLRVIRV